MAAEFEFRREWLVAASMVRVQAVLVDLAHYPEWWPQVRAVAHVDDDTARVLGRSALPHTLDLELRAVRRDRDVLEVDIAGDLTGWARFSLAGEGAATRITYEQHVAVVHRGFAVASRMLRPVLRWNHDHMMRGCEAGLQERLATAAS